MLRSAAMAAGLSSLITSATAITPASLPPLAKSNGVLPSSARASALSRRACGTSVLVEMKERLPPSSSSSFSVAVRPLPGRARETADLRNEQLVFLGAQHDGAGKGMFAALLQRGGEGKKGAFGQAVGREHVGHARFALGDGAGLIQRDDFGLAGFFQRTAVLKRMPFFAPRPLPTMMATGVASRARTGS